MPWTSVSKPTGADYTYVNTQGKEQYDQPNLSFDDPSVYYDGINLFSWTSVPKPSDGRTIFPGMATGIITPPTYSRSYDVSPWVKLSKPLD